MMTHHKHPMRRVTGPVLCLLSLMFLAAGPAAAGEDVKGWMVALDVALTHPGGLDQEYAFQSNTLTTPAQGTRHLIDNDSDATFRITGGYSFGLDLGGLEVSYWGFDNDDSKSATLSGYVIPTVFGYGYGTSFTAPYLSNPYGVSTRAQSSVKATSFDVDYSRAMDAGNKFTFRWLAGLRSVTFQEEVTFDGTGSNYGYDYNIRQRRKMDSDAFGIKVGGRGSFEFTNRFSLEGSAALSLLQADTTGSSSQTITELSSLVASSEENQVKGNSGRGQILDLDIRGIWTDGPLSVYLGYTASSWEGLVRDPNPTRSPWFPTTSGRSRDSVSFDGFNVGVIYRFGARGLIAP